MNANSTRNVVVDTRGTQVVAHVGLHALGSFADRLGVGERLSSAVGWSGPGVPVHDRGRVLCQAMLMLAGGGESCTDIESLAAQGRLFGDVCSDSTLYRTFTDSLDGDTLVRGPPRNRQDPRRSMGTHTGGDRWWRPGDFGYRRVAGGDPLGEQRRHRPQFQRWVRVPSGVLNTLCEVSER